MKLTLQDNGVRLNGEITFQNATTVLREFKALRFSDHSIQLYCADINNASSVSLAVLLEMKKVLTQQQKQTVIKGLSSPLRALIAVNQLTDLLH